MNRLLTPALFLTSTACFQVEDILVLTEKGGATLEQSNRLSDGFWSAVQEISQMGGQPNPMDEVTAYMPRGKKAKKAMKSHGVTLKEHEIDITSQTWSTHWTVEVAELSALDHVAGLMSSRSEPPSERAAMLSDLGDGTVRLSWRRPPSPASPEDLGPQNDGDLPPEQAERFMALMVQMMGEASSLRLSTALVVPGEIVSVHPDWGTVEGNRVTWAITGDSMPNLSDPALQEHVSVIFRPTTPLPPSAFR